MPALPPSTDFTGPTVTEGGFKAALNDMRGFLAGLLGTTGNAIDALTALTVPWTRYLTRTAATTVVTGDRGRLFDCSGTWTMTLPAAASAGAGWVCEVRNSGSGTITLDGNGSETVDGATTRALAPGQGGVLICTGTGWVTMGMAARADSFLFARDTVLGAVAQSGGVPTGRLIETGSNANGTYARWADGTQMCWQNQLSDAALDATWTFPAVFIAAPEVVAACRGADRFVSPGATGVSTTAYTFRCWFWNGTALGRSTQTCSLIAVGRWFT
jgi:hypothetical protein